MRKYSYHVLAFVLLALLLLCISAAQATSNFYVISFDVNGGDFTIDPMTKYPGEAASIPSSCPTRRGYNFLGWGTSADGEAVYQPTDSYSDDGDAFSGCGQLTVYAPAGSTAQTLAENNGWIFITLE